MLAIFSLCHLVESFILLKICYFNDSQEEKANVYQERCVVQLTASSDDESRIVITNCMRAQVAMSLVYLR